MLEFIRNIDIAYLVIGQGAISLILFVLVIITMIQNMKWKKRYKRFMTGKNARNMEETIMTVVDQYKKMRSDHIELRFKVESFAHDIKGSYKKIGIIRYDAFKGMKGKLSFAICLLDDYDSGFILNSMKGAEGNYTYMKEIIRGKSIVVLGEEEKQALEEALHNEKFD